MVAELKVYKKMKVSLIGQYSPSAKEIGGIQIFNKNLYDEMKKLVETKFYGYGIKGVKFDDEYFISIADSANEMRGALFMLNLFLKGPFLKIHKKDIIHVQRPDHVIPFFFKKNKIVLTLHGAHIKNVKLNKGKLAYLFYKMLQNIAFRRANLIIPVSKDTEDYFKETTSLLDNKTVIIPPGVSKIFRPLDKASLKEKYKIKEKHTLVYVGRIDPEKNVVLIAENLKGEDICLLIAGIGSEQHKIESLAKKHENIRYLGKVPNENLAEIYNLADALVMLSEYEGMPTVVLESLTCGVPVITTDVGDVSKAIKDGITGYIATKENFKEKVLQLLNEDKSYKEDCIKMSKEYSWENVANKLYDAYKNM